MFLLWYWFFARTDTNVYTIINVYLYLIYINIYNKINVYNIYMCRFIYIMDMYINSNIYKCIRSFLTSNYIIISMLLIRIFIFCVINSLPTIMELSFFRYHLSINKPYELFLNCFYPIHEYFFLHPYHMSFANSINKKYYCIKLKPEIL
jgi:hypothetical protein